MKISVLVIAHNEENNIAACLSSLMRQTRKPDEIILIVHNSTDATYDIAQQCSYPITIVRYDGTPGIVAARLEGFRYVKGDHVLCIDGDSCAQQNWVQEMSAGLNNGNILVGSKVWFKGNIFNTLLNVLGFVGGFWKRKTDPSRIWGTSFGFWSRDLPQVEFVYKDSEVLSRRLGLSRNPEDYWLALTMAQKACLEFIATTSVVCHVKESTVRGSIDRFIENARNGKKIRQYVSKTQ